MIECIRAIQLKCLIKKKKIELITYKKKKLSNCVVEHSLAYKNKFATKYIANKYKEKKKPQKLTSFIVRIGICKAFRDGRVKLKKKKNRKRPNLF